MSIILFTFGTLSIVQFFILKQRVEDWILSQSSGKSLLSWAPSTELVSTSGKKNEKIKKEMEKGGKRHTK
jgi:hypothetical protein